MTSRLRSHWFRGAAEAFEKNRPNGVVINWLLNR